jgi:glucose/arabinose dehydrogenase
MTRTILISLLALAMQTAVAQPIIQLQTFASGFTRPVDIASAGDERLFIAEQRGIIHILNAQGQRLPTPFLNIQSRVNSASNERGLLGLVFHPNFAQNGYFYVNYTNTAGNTRVSRFNVSAADPNVADPDSELLLLAVNQPFSNHNAGDLNFGPDGYLYFGLGDGGSGGDPQNYSQNRQSFLGKMIRIDVNSGSPYSVPPTNPFVNDASTLDEIWAVGLRNPWKFSFDRLTGDMWIGDVGQNAWEEIDFQPAASTGGENYGWRCYEGNAAYNTSGCQGAAAYKFPVHVFANGFNSGCSVTGGFVYRGSEFPDLYGHYLYTDYCAGKIWSLTPNGSGGWTNRQLLQGAANQYVSFGENQNGEMFLAAISAGTILRIREICSAFQVAGTPADETCAGEANGSIQLNITNPGATQTIAWSNGASTSTIGNLAAGTYTVTVTSSNTCARTQSFTISNGSPGPQTPIQVAGNMLSLPDVEFFVSYQWLLNGQPIPNADGLSYTALESGVYSAQATAMNGCTYTWPSVTVVVSSIAEIRGLQRFSVSPNPVRDLLTVEMQLENTAPMTLRLVDAAGKTVWELRERIGGLWRTELDMSRLPAGVYSLSLSRSRREQTTLQLVKQ